MTTIWLILAYIAYAFLTFMLASMAGTSFYTIRRMLHGQTFNSDYLHPMWYFVNFLFFGLPLYFVGDYVGEHGSMVATVIVFVITLIFGFWVGITKNAHA